MFDWMSEWVSEWVDNLLEYNNYSHHTYIEQTFNAVCNTVFKVATF